MAINKVIFGGDILIDLTSDTVEDSDVLTGKKFHGKDGEVTTGTCTYDADTSDANAAAAEILDTKTAYVSGSKVTGSMPNNGSVTGYITDKDTPYSIPTGFHDGGGTVGLTTTDYNNLDPTNIRENVTILGVTGTMSGTEDMVSTALEVDSFVGDEAVTYTPTSEDDFNCYASVTVNPISYTETTNVYGTTITIG